ncbi:MAG: glycoside hydrolase family 20 zincin-like fold domain-containing protein [Anaerolineae bacterium]
MDVSVEHLIPQPQSFELSEGAFSLSDEVLIHLTNAVSDIQPIAERLRGALADHGVRATLSAVNTEIREPHIALRLDTGNAVRVQGYSLVVTPDVIRITGADAVGLFYGVCTLAQLLTLSRDEDGITVPALRIEDWPDFPNRGVMLDVSRDRVPKMETLYELVDMLAGWKINQLQLYMEHTFAYRGHEVVWEDASPFTGEEILALDDFCSERFVELVPNQNSFGHMTRWLIHDEYNHLAECPDGCELWAGHPGEPFSLCPIDPGSKELLVDLYDQLLPHFQSDLFNVGLDETFDLGKGRSSEVCEERGTERVYLDFLKEIHTLVQARGKTMQFWGDIILHEPDLIPELPQDAIAMEWGYSASHPFEAHTKLFAEAGLRFYVCPGTSTWNTIAGRTENALANIQSAAESGHATGAAGLLNTNWGDNGHMQPLPVSFLGYMVGAAASWNADAKLSRAELTPKLDRFAFADAAGVMGEVAYDLGNVYRLPGDEPSNASVLFLLMLYPERSLDDELFSELSRDALAITRDRILEIRDRLSVAEMARADADLVLQEFTWAADILEWATRLGMARIEHEATETAASMPSDVRGPLAEELQALVERYRELWLRRSRPGGLADSAGRLERVVDLLQG